MAEQQKQYITPETKAKLEAELQALIDHRPVVAAEINERREEGDLKENGGYIAAKEEQGKMEARIRQLEDLLRNAVVGQSTTSEGEVGSGMVVTVDMFGDEEKFLLGSREISGHSDLDVYSEKSPLGAAILGAKVGDTVSYEAPNGKTVEVKVLAATPYTG